MLISRVLGKGQVVIPKEARKKTNLAPGDKVEVKVTKEGILILPLKKSYRRLGNRYRQNFVDTMNL